MALLIGFFCCPREWNIYKYYAICATIIISGLSLVWALIFTDLYHWLMLAGLAGMALLAVPFAFKIVKIYTGKLFKLIKEKTLEG